MYRKEKEFNKVLESRQETRPIAGWKKEKTEGVTGLGRITRERTERWNQMTALGMPLGRPCRSCIEIIRLVAETAAGDNADFEDSHRICSSLCLSR